MMLARFLDCRRLAFRLEGLWLRQPTLKFDPFLPFDCAICLKWQRQLQPIAASVGNLSVGLKLWVCYVSSSDKLFLALCCLSPQTGMTKKQVWQSFEPALRLLTLAAIAAATLDVWIVPSTLAQSKEKKGIKFCHLATLYEINLISLTVNGF